MLNVPERFIKLSESELYVELATALWGGHAAPPDSEAAEQTGYAYYQNALPTIRGMVCGSAIVASLVKKDDVFALSSAIAEVISAHFQLPTAAATMAVLAARMGLKALCPGITQ